MSVTPPQAVDWTGWAANADTRVCRGCDRPFKPNHPRRWYCMRPACPGRRRVRKDAAKRRREERAQQKQPTIDRSTVVHGVFGNVLVEINRSTGPAGSRSEMAGALKAMVLAERTGDHAGTEKAIVALLSAGVMRIYHTKAGRPPEKET